MKKSLLLAAASLAVIACSKRTIGEAPVDPNLPADNVVRFSSAASTATVSKAGLDADGHSTFEENDEIGIYAVLHTTTGTSLGAATGVFPTNTDFQYFNRQYKVTSVAPYDATTTPVATPAIATFEPVKDASAVAPLLQDNTMYYLSGGQAWNYYAYYPFSLTNELMDAASTSDFVMPNTLALSSAYANFVGKSDKSGLAATTPKKNFFDQTALVTSTSAAPAPNAYPGPIMFAYYGDADKQATLGTAQKPVRLKFKYAVAKLTLNVKISEDVIAVPTSGTTNTNISQLKAIAMEGEGMFQGFKFDLTKAKEVSTGTGNSGVYDVVTSITDDATNAPAMAAWTNKATFPVFTGTTPYTGYLFKVPVAADTKLNANGLLIAGSSPAAYKKTTEFQVTGYLVPAGNDADLRDQATTNSQNPDMTGTLKNVFIKFYVSKQTGGANPEVYTVILDPTKGGTVTSGTPTPKNYLPSIAPGKEYKFNITLDKEKIQFEGEIEDWDVVEPNGSDEIPAV